MTVEPELPPTQKIKVLGREFAMPRSRRWRVALGFGLMIGGVLGFLPILGFWMLPLGVLILSYEFAWVRRYRRRGSVWWGRRRAARAQKRNQPQQGDATADLIQSDKSKG